MSKPLLRDDVRDIQYLSDLASGRYAIAKNILVAPADYYRDQPYYIHDEPSYYKLYLQHAKPIPLALDALPRSLVYQADAVPQTYQSAPSTYVVSVLPGSEPASRGRFYLPHG